MQHVHWGARPDHYFIVQKALVGAIQELSGDAWFDALDQDWRDAIGTVAALMLEGARSRPPPPPRPFDPTSNRPVSGGSRFSASRRIRGIHSSVHPFCSIGEE